MTGLLGFGLPGWPSVDPFNAFRFPPHWQQYPLRVAAGVGVMSEHNPRHRPTMEDAHCYVTQFMSEGEVTLPPPPPVLVLVVASQ